MRARCSPYIVPVLMLFAFCAIVPLKLLAVSGARAIFMHFHFSYILLDEFDYLRALEQLIGLVQFSSQYSWSTLELPVAGGS